MRQGFKTLKPRAVKRTIAGLARKHGHDGAQVTWAQAPQVQISESITVGLNRLAHLRGDALIWIHIEQDAPRVAQQAKRPVRNDERPDDAGQRLHPHPAKASRQDEARNRQYRYRGVRHYMNVSGTNIIVPMR